MTAESAKQGQQFILGVWFGIDYIDTHCLCAHTHSWNTVSVPLYTATSRPHYTLV